MLDQARPDANLQGTHGSDVIEGTTGSDRIFGRRGDDTIRGNGGQDKLNGSGGDDYVEGLNSFGLTGIYGQSGNDTLVGSIPGAGQIHMGGGTGDDRIVMDLTNNSGWQGHHVYGNEGADRFEFRNVDQIESPVLGRIDDLDLSQDSIWLEGKELDLYNLPSGVRVVSYLGQQWLSIEDKAIYALEGARDGGLERHFSGLPDDGIGSLPTVEFVDQRNFVPQEFKPGDMSQLNEIVRPADQASISGTEGADWMHDYAFTRTDDAGNHVETADSFIAAGAGDDVVEAGKGHDTVRGQAGDDAMAGGSDNDKLYGDAGNDTLFGGSEDDFVEGADGNDVLYGGTDNDQLAGNAGHDTMMGGDGVDRICGQEGNDVIWAGAGDDRQLFGQEGDDRIYGQEGDDYLSGWTGNDTLDGGTGNDRLKGHWGDDDLSGGAGHDNLLGGDGADTVNGGSGDDVITGDGGRDVLTGGAGSDTFVFHGGDMLAWGDLEGTADERFAELDVITDFEVGTDQLRFSSSSGVSELGDLKAWEVDVGGDLHFAINVRDTDERILIDVEDTASWGDVMDDANFLFG